MSTPTDTCLHCGETRAAVKANGLYCATVDGYGECSEEWPRHRWADWNDRELAAWGVLPQFMHLHRRDDERDLQFLDCTHLGKEHRPGNPAEDECDPPAHICVCCWADLNEEEPTNE